MHSKILYRAPIVIVFLLALLTAPLAECQSLYGQAEIAQATIDDNIDSGSIDIDLDESTTAFRLAFGYEWNDVVALEAGYSNLGEVDADLVIGRAEAEADGFELALVVRWPLGERFALAGRGGWFWWEGKTRLAGLSASESGGDPLFGIGGEFKATERAGITLGWSRYRLDDLDVDYASIGIRFRFGGTR